MGDQKSIILLSLFCFFFLEVSAQVGIGTTSPDPSSVLDIQSANSGVLIPRIALTSSTDVTTISSPEESLLIYNSSTITGDVTPGYYYWKDIDGRWTRINDNSDKVYGEIYNNTVQRTQDMNPTAPIRFHFLGEIHGVNPISPGYQGFEIIRSGVYRVSYSISIEQYDSGSGGTSEKILEFYLTTGSVSTPGDDSNLLSNSIPGSFSYSRVVNTGKASFSMTKIVHLETGDHIRLFQNKSYTGIYVLRDSATMNIELIQAD